MLLTKVRENRPVGSGKENFEGFLPYMGVAAILVMLPRCHEQTFVPPTQGGSTLNLALIGQAVLEKMLEIVNADGRQTDGRRSMCIL